MKKQLRNSPLVYVLAQVRISPIMELKDYIPKLQEVIRKNFPLFNTIDIQTVEVRSQGEPEFRKITQWHFADKFSTTGIIADTNAITIHTTQYNSFESLVERFSEVLDRFNAELNISLFTRIGLRYVNVIPSEPKKYLNKELLGFHLKESYSFKSKFIARTETIQETKHGLIKVKASYFSGKDFIQHGDIKELLIHKELRQSIAYLTFDRHKQKVLSGSFSTLDIDHFMEDIEKKEDFQVAKIKEKLSQLHDGIYHVFENAVTDMALKEWA